MFRVSVETGMEEIKSHLNTCGYDVVDMGESIRPVQAVIYAGPVARAKYRCRYDSNSPLFINATNLSKEEILEDLQAPFQ